MPSNFLFNSTATKISSTATRGTTGDWTESNATSSYTFPCSLQPLSVNENEYQVYQKETTDALYKMYWQGTDTNGALITLDVDDKVSISGTTYEVLGIHMDMAGRARVYKAILERFA